MGGWWSMDEREKERNSMGHCKRSIVDLHEVI